MEESLGDTLKILELIKWSTPKELEELIESIDPEKINLRVSYQSNLESNLGFFKYSVVFKSLNNFLIDIAYICNFCQDVNIGPPRLEVENINNKQILNYFCKTCNENIYKVSMEIGKKFIPF